MNDARSVPGSPQPADASSFVPKVEQPPRHPRADDGQALADLTDHPRYEVLKLLGRGGMGAVHQARHKVMNRLVAVKVIRASLVDDTQAVERFQREVQAAARLDHPNIVRAYDADRAGATHFLVMEFVAGTDLAQHLRTHGPLPPAEACGYIRQAALALQHAHEQGMVHRDVKPANLLLTAAGTIKVLDFGLARFVREGEGRGLTGANVAMGTADYIAPEQARNARAADIRADIYSLGCTWYHLLTVTPPVRGSEVEKLAGHLAGAVPLHALPAGTPAGMRAALARMVAREPEQRYATPAEVVQALTPFVEGHPPKAGAAAQPARGGRGLAGDDSTLIDAPVSRRWAALVGTAVLMFLVVAGLTWWAVGKRPSADTAHAPEANTSAAPTPLPPHYVNRLGMEFVLVPGGTFWMDGGGGTVGKREVTIPFDFYLGKYEVTQAEWQAITEVNPSHFAPSGAGRNDVASVPAEELKQFPVESVSWPETLAMLVRLNEQAGESGWVYRLPMEAEWEYACRGGPLTDKRDYGYYYYFADGPTNVLLPNRANFKHANGLKQTCRVGRYPPNRLGLHDMHGNVWEWCADTEKLGGARMKSGGCFGDPADRCQATTRFIISPLDRYSYLGARVARVPVAAEGK